jgi:hypothetical protein
MRAHNRQVMQESAWSWAVDRPRQESNLVARRTVQRKQRIADCTLQPAAIESEVGRLVADRRFKGLLALVQLLLLLGQPITPAWMGALRNRVVGAGGIAGHLGDYFLTSRFRERFEDKGRFKDYLSAIATGVITAPHAALDGAAQALRVARS